VFLIRSTNSGAVELSRSKVHQSLQKKHIDSIHLEDGTSVASKHLQ
jgi:hypothetical protein